MFVAWRDLRFARGRFALMGVVIVLITMLVVMLSGLTAGLGRENTSAIVDLPADHLAFSAPADGEDVSFSDSVVDASVWRDWAQVPGVEHAEPLAIATTRAEAGERTTAVSVFGVEPGSTLAPSSAPRSVVGAEVGDSDASQAPTSAPISDLGGAVLSEGAAEGLGVGVGDVVEVAGGALEVTAIAGDASYSHTPVIWTSLEAAQPLVRTASTTGPEAAGDGDLRATVIALTFADGTAAAPTAADLRAADATLGTQTVALAATLNAIGSYAAENGSLQLMRGFLFAISALVIGAFFTVWTIQRSGDVAVLKALGASTGYLLRDALGQAVVLLVLGTALGAGIAAGLGAAVQGSVPFVLDPATVVLPTAVMVVLGAAGAALSIRRITSVDPLTALGSAR